MEEFVRRALFQQPFDRLVLGDSGCATFNQWVKLRTQSPCTDDGNCLVVGHLRCQFVLSFDRKDGVRLKRHLFLQPLELLDELATL